LIPVSDALTVTAALSVPLSFPLRRGAVFLLGFPAQPFPRRPPASFTAARVDSSSIRGMSSGPLRTDHDGLEASTKQCGTLFWSFLNVAYNTQITEDNSCDYP
jgi:hypothetical protein